MATKSRTQRGSDGHATHAHAIPRLGEFVFMGPHAIPRLGEFVHKGPHAIPRLGEFVHKGPHAIPRLGEFISCAGKIGILHMPMYLTQIGGLHPLYILFIWCVGGTLPRRIGENRSHLLFKNILPIYYHEFLVLVN